MANETWFRNGLKDARLEAGIATAAELARRADVDPDWYAHIEAGRMLPTPEEFARLQQALGGIQGGHLYDPSYRTQLSDDPYADKKSGSETRTVAPEVRTVRAGRISDYWRDLTEAGHMLVTPDEITWFESHQVPDRQVDVFVNMSCSTQKMPHLLLETVAVLDALDVSFAAAAGAPACCGKPFLRGPGGRAKFERVNRANLDHGLSWGAGVHVNWCTSCQVTSTAVATRRELADNHSHPAREVQILTFLEERVRELGDSMPWRNEVSCRVLVESHSAASQIHAEAQRAGARLLALVPGVEVVDLYDGWSDGSPCAPYAPADDLAQEHTHRWPSTPEGVQAQRAWLADYVQARGADTVACQQQYCHFRWSRYASERLAVRHPVSVLAEALGCAYPDRHQAAVRLGNPEELLEQTRHIWESWGMSEDRARDLAVSISDPMFADAAAQDSCGSSRNCRENLISIDVLTGASSPA